MPRAKTPRNGSTTPTSTRSKQVIPMPEGGAPVLVKKPASDGHARPTELESAIRLRAYEIYEERGREPGRECEDWFRAEREITARYPEKAQQQSA